MIFFFFFNYLFIWLHWVLVAASGIFITSLVAARALLLCGMWDLSSLTKDWTPIPYITGQILNQWTSREVPEMIFFFFFSTAQVSLLDPEPPLWPWLRYFHLWDQPTGWFGRDDILISEIGEKMIELHCHFIIEK